MHFGFFQHFLKVPQVCKDVGSPFHIFLRSAMNQCGHALEAVFRRVPLLRLQPHILSAIDPIIFSKTKPIFRPRAKKAHQGFNAFLLRNCVEHFLCPR